MRKRRASILLFDLLFLLYLELHYTIFFAQSRSLFQLNSFWLRLGQSVHEMLCQVTFAALICSQLFHAAIATTHNTTVSGWVDDPDGRGTFSIVSSCVLTLTLCVYTAIHLNVRPYKQTELQSWIETAKWVVFGILAPELVVFVAWRQYISVTALDRVVTGLQESDQPSGISRNESFNGRKVEGSSRSSSLHPD